MENKIENIEDFEYIGAFRKGMSVMIDVVISGFLRIVFAQILWNFWLQQKVKDFQLDFYNKFNTDIIGNDLEHLTFLTQHKVTQYTLIFFALIILIGALYHAVLDSSSWCATIGKRIMNCFIISNEGKKLSFLHSLTRYFLSLVPWVFMLYIMLYVSYHQVTFFDALVNNKTNLIVGLITVIWIQIYLFNKRKVAAHDLICNTSLIKGRVGGKFPKLFS